jgi:hypothetical protein
LAILGLSNSATNLQPARDSAKDSYDSLINAAVIILYFICFGIFAVKLAGKQDGFLLKKEYQLVGLGSGSLFILWFVKILTKFPCNMSSCRYFSYG